MSFPANDSLTEKPRPVIIRELAYEGMSEREAGDIIQILLQIEDYRTIATGKTFRKESPEMLKSLDDNATELKKARDACKTQIFEKSKASPPKFPLLHDLITIEDYLPIQNMLMQLTFEIDDKRDQYTKQYNTAEAYNALVLDRLKDLREKSIAHEPTIKSHLRHRLAQIGETYKAIGLRQQCFAKELSQLDGLLRSRLEAREQYSVHCAHLMILILTVFAILYYLPHVLDDVYHVTPHLINYFKYLTNDFFGDYFKHPPEPDEKDMEKIKWMLAFVFSLVLLLAGGRILYFKKSKSRSDAEKACEGSSNNSHVNFVKD